MARRGRPRLPIAELLRRGTYRASRHRDRLFELSEAEALDLVAPPVTEADMLQAVTWSDAEIDALLGLSEKPAASRGR
jgi:hypothetical protein